MSNGGGTILNFSVQRLTAGSRRSKDGFTLYELLLVVGLVATVWVAILPALNDFHESALSTQCQSNLRQLAMLCQTYALKEGYYPWGMVDPGQHKQNYWDDDGLKMLYPRENPLLHGVTNWSEYATFCWDFRKKSDALAGWQCGEMFQGLQVDSLACCPKCKTATTDNWDGNRLTGYNYNVCFLGYVENDSGKRKYPTKQIHVKYPERVVVFGDGGYAGGPNKFMRAPIQDKTYDNSSSSLRKAGTQAFRHGRNHNRHCNMAFLDGHVEKFMQPYKAGGKKGWVDEASHTAFISSGNGIYGPRGFGEVDDDEPRP